jgi:hypothetical protein
MTLQKLAPTFACLVACCLLWSCTAIAPLAPPAPPATRNAQAVQTQQPEPAALSEQYAQLGAAGGRVMRLQPDASEIRVHVFRAGRAVNLGHNHVLSAPEFEGYLYWPEQGSAASRFDLVFRLDQLVFDVPGHRAALGSAFAAVLSDQAIAATREHMLGPDNMQADRYPLVRIRSLEITGEAPKFAARIAIELHGQTREMRVPLTVTGLPQCINASGSLVLRQSDFGVQPYSVMGGLLAVQDDVVLEFSLAGE